MKKKFIASIMSLSMIFSMFSSSIPVVQAKEKTDDIDYSSYQTGRLEETEEGQEWLNDNMLNIESKEQVDQVVGSESNEIQLYSANPCAENPYNEIEGEIPSSVDNSTAKYFPPVAYQIGGSCVSYSLTYYVMTYDYNKYHNTSANCDENIMSPRWTYNLTNGGKDAGSVESSCVRILRDNGAASISDVPIKYSGSRPENYHTDYFARDDIWERAQDNRIKDGYYIKIGDSQENTPITSPKDEDLNLIKYALSKGEIFSFGTDIYTFRYGIISQNNQVPENDKYVGEYIVGRCDYGSGGPHQMTIVGYDDDIWYDINENGIVDEGEKGAFKVANSWGTSYKNSGFVWVSYDALNKVSSVYNENISGTTRYTAIDSNIVLGLIMEDESENENYYLEVVANSSDRSQTQIAVSDINEEIIESLNPVFDGLRGGSYGYDGTTNATDGKFIFDLNRYNSILTKDKILNEGFKINISNLKADSNNVSIKSLTLVDKNKNSRTPLIEKPIKVEKSTIEVYSKDNDVESPNNLSAKIENGKVSLNWSIKNNESIAYYQVYRNGLYLGKTTDTTFTDDSDINGNYLYAVRSVDINGNISKKENTSVNNSYCKIYYKNSNYSSSYIHYRINSDSWTIAPGVKMNSSSDKQGYLEYIIDLSEYSENSSIIACFNNGNGAWDNNGGKNYSLKKGTFTVENGCVNEEKKPLKLVGMNIESQSPQPIGKTIIITPIVEGGSGNYYCSLRIEKGNHTLFDGAKKIYYWKPTELGNYQIYCYVEDKVTGERTEYSDAVNFRIINEKPFEVTGIDFSDDSCELRNSAITFNVKTNADDLNNNISYKVLITDPSGNESNLYPEVSDITKFKYYFTDLIGTYTINVKATNNDTGEESNKTVNYEIKDGPLTIKSFKAVKNYYDSEELKEVKASDYYYLVAQVVGGIGKYSYQYGYYYNDKYYKIDGNDYSYLYPQVEKPGNYKFELVVKDETGNSVTVYKNVKITQGDLRVLPPEMDNKEVKLNDYININFKSKFSIDAVKYKVTDQYKGESEVIQDFTYGDTFKYKATKGGYHTLFIEGKDSRGIVSSNSVNIRVTTDPIVIDSFKADKDTIELGENVKFEIKSSGGYGKILYNIIALDENSEFTYIKENCELKEITWKPSKIGKYKIRLDCYDDAYNYENSTIEVTVTEPARLSTTTIYYKGYDNPYIHYRIADGTWTTAPGVKMEENSEVDGYNYAITIDLGDKDTLEACFNNGNGQWDSNGGKNYKFSTGYYTCSDGVITEIEKPTKQLKIDSITSKLGTSYVSGNENIFKVQSSNGEGKVEYRFEYKNNTTGDSGVLRDYVEYNTLSTYLSTPGQYTLTVYAKDEAGNTDSKTLDFTIEEYKNLEIKSVTSSLGDTFQKGKTTQLTINTTGGKGSNYYSMEVNGETILKDSSSNSVSWTPIEAGIYKIVATARETQGGTVSYTKTITIEDKVSNQTTIYYKGYDNPYIHYRIGNGAWTNAPGVKMSSNSDVDGYNYAITLDLGDADQLTACFNNGSNSWDSNGGNNYTFKAGYYTYSNGVITKIEKPSSELKINSITCSSGSTIKMGSTVDLTVNASGGEGPYTYTLYYSAYGSGRTSYIIKEQSNNTGKFTPDYPQMTTIYAEVVDSTGNKVKYTQKFDVKDNTSNQTTIYYKGYDNPYIHYQIGNGAWTNAPGVKMEKTSEKPGYDYKITIDLGDADNLIACFNNGNGSWDSNNGKNYAFGVGDYIYSNGNITKIN